MAKFNEYTQKATPEDNDTLMIYDNTSKANKLSPFSGIWNWMVNKLTNAVIANLQTNNKTVLGAINELNSKTYHTFYVQNQSILEYAISIKESVTIISFGESATDTPCTYGWAIIFRTGQDSKIITLDKLTNSIFICTKADSFSEWSDWSSIK